MGMTEPTETGRRKELKCSMSLFPSFVHEATAAVTENCCRCCHFVVTATLPGMTPAAKQLQTQVFQRQRVEVDVKVRTVLSRLDSADVDVSGADNSDKGKYTASRTFAHRRMESEGLRKVTHDDMTKSGGVSKATLRLWESNGCIGTGSLVDGGEDECGAAPHRRCSRGHLE